MTPEFSLDERARLFDAQRQLDVARPNHRPLSDEVLQVRCTESWASLDTLDGFPNESADAASLAEEA